MNKAVKHIISALLVVSLVMMASCSGRAARAGSYDVVVIGGGAAGLAASIEAAEAGASVALLEKMPMVGGSTVLSGGIVYATGSRLQEGVEDSVEDLVAYWSDRADGKNNPDFLHFVADHSGETIDWLLDMDVELEGPGVSGTSPVLRALTSTTHGAGIINPMKAKAESLGVEIHTRTAATGLVNKDGKISGVLAEDRDGKALRFDAGAVVLASGGFDRNPELMQELAPVALGQKTFAGSGNNGDGLLMAREQGADVVSHGGVIGFRAVEGEPAYTSDICMLMWFPYMYVNLGGERFINELTDYPLFYEELIRQEDQTAYMIFDGNSYVETLDRAVEKGSAFRASTLKELAALTGIDAAGLESTVVEYNSMIDAGVDSDFGKPLAGLPRVDNPDYYALKIIPAILGTLSGVKVNLDTQVLDGSDSPIPGLYAAGEVANGSFYNTVYPASGTSIQMSLTFGRVAGAGAAAFAK